MFTTISNWFGSLDSTMQVFWACAVAASVVFVIQNALMLLGIGDMDSDVDADVSSDFDVHTDRADIVDVIRSIRFAADGVEVWTLNGARVGHFNSAAELKQLRTGIYIINGKKVQVK